MCRRRKIERCDKCLRNDLLRFDLISDIALDARVSSTKEMAHPDFYLLVDASSEISSACIVTRTSSDQSDKNHTVEYT